MARNTSASAYARAALRGPRAPRTAALLRLRRRSFRSGGHAADGETLLLSLDPSRGLTVATSRATGGATGFQQGTIDVTGAAATYAVPIVVEDLPPSGYQTALSLSDGTTELGRLDVLPTGGVRFAGPGGTTPEAGAGTITSPGGAARYNGTSQHHTLPVPTLAATNAGFGWFKPAAIPSGDTTLFTCRSSVDPDTIAIDVVIYSTALLTYRVRGDGGAGNFVTAPGVIVAGAWNFVAWSRSGNELSVWLNSSTPATLTIPAPGTITPNVFLIGANNASGTINRRFAGAMDRWGLAPSATLTSADVAELRGGGPSGAPGYADLSPALAAKVTYWYEFDNVGGSPSTASSTGGPALTAVGSPGIATGVGEVATPHVVVLGYDSGNVYCGLDGGTLASAARTGGAPAITRFRLGGGGVASGVCTNPMTGSVGGLVVAGLSPAAEGVNAALANGGLGASADELPDAIQSALLHDIAPTGDLYAPWYDHIGGTPSSTRSGVLGTYATVLPPISRHGIDPDDSGYLLRIGGQSGTPGVDFGYSAAALTSAPLWSKDPCRFTLAAGSSGRITGRRLSSAQQWLLVIPGRFRVGNRAGTIWPERSADGSGMDIALDADGYQSVRILGPEGVELANVVSTQPIHGLCSIVGQPDRVPITITPGSNPSMVVVRYDFVTDGDNPFQRGDFVELDGAHVDLDGQRLRVTEARPSAFSLVTYGSGSPTLASSGITARGLGTVEDVLKTYANPADNTQWQDIGEMDAEPTIGVRRDGDTIHFYSRSHVPISSVTVEGLPLGPADAVAYLGTAPGGTAAGITICGRMQARTGAISDAAWYVLMTNLGRRLNGTDGWLCEPVTDDWSEVGTVDRRLGVHHWKEHLILDADGGLADDWITDDTGQALMRAAGDQMVRNVGSFDLSADANYTIVSTMIDRPYDDSSGVARDPAVLYRDSVTIRRRAKDVSWRTIYGHPVHPDATAASANLGHTPALPLSTHAAMRARSRPRTEWLMAAEVDWTEGVMKFGDQAADGGTYRTRTGPISVRPYGGSLAVLRWGGGQDGVAAYGGSSDIRVDGIDFEGTLTGASSGLAFGEQSGTASGPTRGLVVTRFLSRILGAEGYCVRGRSRSGGNLEYSCLDLYESSTESTHEFFVKYSQSQCRHSGFLRYRDNGYAVDDANHAIRMTGLLKCDLSHWRRRTEGADPTAQNILGFRQGIYHATFADWSLQAHRFYQHGFFDGPGRTSSGQVTMARISARANRIDHIVGGIAVGLTATETLIESPTSGVGVPISLGEHWDAVDSMWCLSGLSVTDGYANGLSLAPRSGVHRNVATATDGAVALAAPSVRAVTVVGGVPIVEFDGGPVGGSTAGPRKLRIYRRAAGDSGDGTEVLGVGAHYFADIEATAGSSYQWRAVAVDAAGTADGTWGPVTPVAV